MSIDAFGKKPFAAALTAPGERRAPAFCSHPGTKTVLAFARAL
jgi:hypothetical protein